MTSKDWQKLKNLISSNVHLVQTEYGGEVRALDLMGLLYDLERQIEETKRRENNGGGGP